MNKKGILLYSGGLDSLLAAKILLEQNIELIGLYFILPFYPPDLNIQNLKIKQLADSINLNLMFYKLDEDYINMLRNPKHGYGKNINPCIDCKIFFLKKSKEIMINENASFVATGEVSGQRPMSQKKNMLRHIEKESGLNGYLVRPLSAKLLEPTIPELNGIIDREKLLHISGRNRKPQMELAVKYNITEYNSPAGGCLFTDKFYSNRLKDVFNFELTYNTIDLYMLTLGRHYRLNKDAKIIVSRNEFENNELEKYLNLSDYFFKPQFKGPNIYVKGKITDNDITLICKIIKRYSKNTENNLVEVLHKNNNFIVKVDTVISDTDLEKIRI